MQQVLISGGTSGIGLAIARGFQCNGYSVIATGATDDEVARASQDNPEISFSCVDVRNKQSIRNFVSGLNRLDVLVNCAGVIRRGVEHDPDVFADVLDVNLTGTMRLCTEAKPLLRESHGCIVNTASMLSFFGGGLVPGYSSSKGGVSQLTKSLAIAYAPDGIRVNAVAPGWIATPLTQSLQDDPERSKPILSRTPLGRWGKPEDIVGPVLFLCSSAAEFVTGVVLPVDGGYLIS
jgi:NAD(P)-dependent dehydrogenase (short-subunit alcohol dehydrogenase family)